MLEYKLNEYITLKLENDQTVIHVNGKEFWSCTKLLLTLSLKNGETYNEIESIDQAVMLLDNDRSFRHISPTEEFWGHCSNLQAWVEHDYDTRIIDSRLGFPLLYELYSSGDIKEKEKFKEEIVKRFASGWLPTIEYLWNMVYLDCIDEEYVKKKDFTEEERQVLLEDVKKAVMKALKDNGQLKKIALHQGYLYLLDEDEKQGLPAIRALREECLNIIEQQREFRTPEDVFILKKDYLPEYLWKGHVEKWKERFSKAPRDISLEKTVTYLILKGYFAALTADDVRSNQKLQQLEKLELTKLGSPYSLKALPDTIGCLGSLKEFGATKSDLRSLPESLFDLKDLRSLDLDDNQIHYLSESLGKLKSLTMLSLRHNKISKLPESIGSLTSLTKVFLAHNKLEMLPESIGNLANLVFLNLEGNRLEKLPQSFYKLKSLKGLILNSNKFNEIPECIFQFTRLEQLELDDFFLSSIPESIGNLVNLKYLNLSFNKLKMLPQAMKELTSLEELDMSYNPLSKGMEKGYFTRNRKGPIYDQLVKDGVIR